MYLIYLKYLLEYPDRLPDMKREHRTWVQRRIRVREDLKYSRSRTNP